jgi:hypothetical protein
MATTALGTSCSHRARRSADISISSRAADPGSSFLLANVVTPGVADTYRRLVITFLMFCEATGISLASLACIDLALVRFFDTCYEDELGPSTGEKTLSGWCFQFPEYTAPQFVLAHKALKAWRRLRPSCGRHPLPWLILCACVAHIAFEAGPGPAVAFLVM